MLAADRPNLLRLEVFVTTQGLEILPARGGEGDVRKWVSRLVNRGVSHMTHEQLQLSPPYIEY